MNRNQIKMIEQLQSLLDNKDYIVFDIAKKNITTTYEDVEKIEGSKVTCWKRFKRSDKLKKVTIDFRYVHYFYLAI